MKVTQILQSMYSEMADQGSQSLLIPCKYYLRVVAYLPGAGRQGAPRRVRPGRTTQSTGMKKGKLRKEERERREKKKSEREEII